MENAITTISFCGLNLQRSLYLWCCPNGGEWTVTRPSGLTTLSQDIGTASTSTHFTSVGLSNGAQYALSTSLTERIIPDQLYITKVQSLHESGNITGSNTFTTQATAQNQVFTIEVWLPIQPITIEPGLSPDIMRKQMETKNQLTMAGDLYVGTGEMDENGCYKTDVLHCGNLNTVLQIDDDHPEYYLIGDDNISSFSTNDVLTPLSQDNFYHMGDSIEKCEVKENPEQTGHYHLEIQSKELPGYNGGYQLEWQGDDTAYTIDQCIYEYYGSEEKEIDYMLYNGKGCWAKQFNYTNGTLPTGVASITGYRVSSLVNAPLGKLTTQNKIYYGDVISFDAQPSYGYWDPTTTTPVTVIDNVRDRDYVQAGAQVNVRAPSITVKTVGGIPYYNIFNYNGFSVTAYPTLHFANGDTLRLQPITIQANTETGWHSAGGGMDLPVSIDVYFQASKWKIQSTTVTQSF